MMTPRALVLRAPLLSILAALALSGCSAEKLYTVPNPTPAQATANRIAIAYGTVEVPIGGDGDATAIAAARGQAMLQLAQKMARDGLR